MPPPPYSGSLYALSSPHLLPPRNADGNMYCIPGSKILQGLANLSLMAALGGKCYQHFHFIEEETEAQRGELTCLRPSPQPPTPSQQVAVDYSPLSNAQGAASLPVLMAPQMQLLQEARGERRENIFRNCF